jgi:hypothetical protein
MSALLDQGHSVLAEKTILAATRKLDLREVCTANPESIPGSCPSMISHLKSRPSLNNGLLALRSSVLVIEERCAAICPALCCYNTETSRFAHLQVANVNCWGANISDVSVLVKLPNIEVLSLSVNSINSLQHFSTCSKLRELYLRKNEIEDLTQVFQQLLSPRLYPVLQSAFAQTTLARMCGLTDSFLEGPDKTESSLAGGQQVRKVCTYNTQQPAMLLEYKCIPFRAYSSYIDAICACCLHIARRCEAYRRLVIRTLPQLDKIDSQDVTRDERAAAAADTSTEMLAFLKAVGIDTAAPAFNTPLKPTALTPAPASTEAESIIKKLDCVTDEKQSAHSQSTVRAEAVTARRLSDSVNVAALRRAMSISDTTTAESVQSAAATGAATAGTCAGDLCKIY